MHFVFRISKKKKSETFADLNVLDKVSSKSSNITLKIGEELKFQNLLIKVLGYGGDHDPLTPDTNKL